jgi:hypothetical protein
MQFYPAVLQNLISLRFILGRRKIPSKEQQIR